jgi:hypothetical protein
VSFGYSTPGPKRQLVVINTLTVGLSETILVAVGGFAGFGTSDGVPVGTSTEAVSVGEPVGVSVVSSVLVGVAVSVGVCEGVSVGGASLVAV